MIFDVLGVCNTNLRVRFLIFDVGKIQRFHSLRESLLDEDFLRWKEVVEPTRKISTQIAMKELRSFRSVLRLCELIYVEVFIEEEVVNVFVRKGIFRHRYSHF